VQSTAPTSSGGNPAVRRSSRKCSLKIAENVELALAVRADARIDHHGAVARAQHERLEVDDHASGGGREVRREPAELLHVFGRRSRQQHGHVVMELVHLDDAGHFDVADAPVLDGVRRHERLASI
jgi:hypothetical protein